MTKINVDSTHRCTKVELSDTGARYLYTFESSTSNFQVETSKSDQYVLGYWYSMHLKHGK